MENNRRYYAGAMTRIEFQQRLKEAKCVIVPIGSCEQHGYHLPLDTDNIIGFNTAMMVAEKTDSIVMPNVNYGQVWSARKFVGSISLSNSTLKAILKDIVMSLEQFGAKNILLYAGHNGNSPAIKDLARDLASEFDYHNIWYFEPSVNRDLFSLLESKIPCGCVHAGEMETSMMLAISPESVQLDKAVAEFPSLPKDAKYRPISWDEYITVGSYGDPSKATADKGKAFVKAAVDDLVHLINDIM